VYDKGILQKREKYVFYTKKHTTFGFDLELSLDSVVSPVKQATVDGECAQPSVEIQLGLVILFMTLNTIDETLA